MYISVIFICLIFLGKQVEKIPGMGVDFSRLDAVTPENGERLRKSLGIPKDAFVLLYLAEFSKRKASMC